MPPRPFRNLRQLSRYRRKLVGERSRARNRIHKALDHDGLRLGGALTDILGMNGRRILDGLLAGRPKEKILASLSGHVSKKRALLEEVLEAELHPHSLWRLRDLLRAHDTAQRSIAELDACTAADLRPYERQLRLLETVPGIDRGSACAILIELGPDLSGFRKPSHVAAWAGHCPCMTARPPTSPAAPAPAGRSAALRRQLPGSPAKALPIPTARGLHGPPHCDWRFENRCPSQSRPLVLPL